MTDNEQKKGSAKMSRPPEGLPIYRVLTGPDEAAFCHRVSSALEMGYQLYGSPAVTFNGEDVIVAQAIIWRGVDWARPEKLRLP
jgi:hypothetical protein